MSAMIHMIVVQHHYDFNKALVVVKLQKEVTRVDSEYFVTIGTV